MIQSCMIFVILLYQHGGISCERCTYSMLEFNTFYESEKLNNENILRNAHYIFFKVNEFCDYSVSSKLNPLIVTKVDCMGI